MEYYETNDSLQDSTKSMMNKVVSDSSVFKIFEKHINCQKNEYICLRNRFLDTDVTTLGGFDWFINVSSVIPK